MNELMLKEFNGQQVRMHIDDVGNPWWEVAGICDIIGIDNASQAALRVEEDERRGIYSNDDVGRRQEKIYVNESGLYTLVLGSRKPEAKAFKKWVTSEVLPSIRKTGQYQSNPMSLAEIVLMNAQALVDSERRHKETELRMQSVEAIRERLVRESIFKKTTGLNSIFYHPEIGKFFVKRVSHQKSFMGTDE